MTQPRALVLFTGTGSVERSLEAAGFAVDNLDMDKKCGATWATDILNCESWRGRLHEIAQLLLLLGIHPGKYPVICLGI